MLKEHKMEWKGNAKEIPSERLGDLFCIAVLFWTTSICLVLYKLYEISSKAGYPREHLIFKMAAQALRTHLIFKMATRTLGRTEYSKWRPEP